MNKKFFSAVIIAVVMAIAGYNVYITQTKSKMSKLALANVEALADDNETQGNVDDCVFHKTETCVALHPTDSSLDKEREQAIWP